MTSTPATDRPLWLPFGMIADDPAACDQAAGRALGVALTAAQALRGRGAGAPAVAPLRQTRAEVAARLREGARLRAGLGDRTHVVSMPPLLEIEASDAFGNRGTIGVTVCGWRDDQAELRLLGSVALATDGASWRWTAAAMIAFAAALGLVIFEQHALAWLACAIGGFLVGAGAVARRRAKARNPAADESGSRLAVALVEALEAVRAAHGGAFVDLDDPAENNLFYTRSWARSF